MEKSYYEIALSNLEFLEASLCDTHYNDLSIMAEQIAEKMLKSVLILEVVDATSTLLSNNLRVVYTKIQDAGIDLGIDRRDLIHLKDVYFEARYPGENYIDVNQSDCAEYIKTMYDIIQAVNNYRSARGLSVKQITPKQLGDSNATSDINTIFDKYRQAYNIITSDDWSQELGRLFGLFDTTDMYVIASKIKDLFL